MPPANAGQRYPAEPLTSEEVRRLLAACGRRGPCGVRDQALLWVLWRTGARVGEVLALRPHHVAEGAIRLTACLKGGDERVLPVEPEMQAAVDRWMEHRRARGVNGAAPLFCSLRGHALDPSHIRRLLARLGRKAGLERRVHAHAFRHAFASELALAGAPLVAIQDALGHRSAATTQTYLRRVTCAELGAALARRPLPDWVLLPDPEPDRLDRFVWQPEDLIWTPPPPAPEPQEP